MKPGYQHLKVYDDEHTLQPQRHVEKDQKKKIDIGIRSNKDENSELKKHKEEKQIH